MTTFKKFFFLTALVAIVFASFATETQAQTSRTEAPAMVFNAGDMDAYYTAKIPSRVRDGETVLATVKKTRTQIIAKVRKGKIVQVGYKSVGKAFVALPQNSGGCLPAGLCASFQIRHCFDLPGGDCICVCGAWITNG
jgi:hypothetical protein